MVLRARGKVCYVRLSGTRVAVRNMPHRYGNSLAVWDHMALPATQQRRHSRLYRSQLMLVLSSATPEGCKSEWP